MSQVCHVSAVGSVPGGADWFTCSSRPAAPRPRLRLLCFPHAGASSRVYAGWAALTPADVQLVTVRLPGRDGRSGEAPVRSAQQAADSLGPSVLQASGDGVPWVFFGHSVGALIAYETAQWLAERGSGTPRLLVVASVPAPRVPRDSALHRLPAKALLDAMEQWGGLPPELAAVRRLAALWLPRIRSDLEVYETYRCDNRAPLACPVIALLGAEDQIVEAAAAEQWSRHTSGRSTLRIVPGDHFFPLTDPAAVLSAALHGELPAPLRPTAGPRHSTRP